jgi:hypothetical protein
VNRELEIAVKAADASAVRRLAKATSINEPCSTADTILEVAIDSIENSDSRLKIVQLLLECGADPSFRVNDECGALFSAVLQKDTQVIRLLLQSGASPNVILDGEPIYSWSEFDYRYDEFDLELPEKPTDADKASEEQWLRYLDQLAIKYGRRRPDYLFALREHGAKTSCELRGDN